MTNKPFAESSEQNKLPILAVLQHEFAGIESVLEIGSGTGQHAVFFSTELPHLRWHTSDVRDMHAGILQWLEEADLENVVPPIALDVATDAWPGQSFDGVFSANTVHIMHWHEVEAMFRGIGRILKPGGRFCLYGPFNYHGTYTSPSNERFDQWLKERDPESGIRDVDDLNALAEQAGLRPAEDYEMPENNRILVWENPATAD